MGPFALLALVWWVFSIISEGRKRQAKRRPPPVQLPVPIDPARKRPPARPLPTRDAQGADPSQLEGSRLEQILRGFEQALEEAQTVKRDPAPTRGGWDAGEELEERGTHDDDAQYEVESLERLENFERPVRQDVAIGGNQEELYQSRLTWSESRGKALAGADHAAFDARIRQPHHVQTVQADKATTDRTRKLRQAIIWREVLGPPVALRGMDRDV